MVDYLNELLAPGTIGYCFLVMIQGGVGIFSILFSLGLLGRVMLDRRYDPPGQVTVILRRVRMRLHRYDIIDELLRDGEITPEEAADMKSNVDKSFARL